MKTEVKEETGKWLISLQKTRNADRPASLEIKSNGSSEAGTGGNLVTPDISKEILSPNFAEGSIYGQCDIYNVGEPFSSIILPIVDQSTRTTTTSAGLFGGMTVGQVTEGSTITTSKPTFSKINLTLEKQVALIPVTTELAQDSLALAEFINKKSKLAILDYIDYQIVYGNGSGTCNGIANTAATFGASATTFVNTTSGGITAGEVLSMYNAYYGGENGVWVMTKKMLNQIASLYASTFYLRYDQEGGAYLYGYPVIVKDILESTTIGLCDFSQYALIQKDLRADVSEHLYFTSAQLAYRLYFRINGSSTWKQKITLADGTTVSPFVFSTSSRRTS